MTKSNATRRALLVSALAIVMCLAMLIGTTFAWFTDTASTAVNKIQAGNLDVELFYKDGGTFKKVNTETKVFDETALWEPGHVEYAVLKAENAGTLALKYKHGINIVSEKGSISVTDKELKLSDYIMFAVIDGDASTTDRAELIAAAEAAGSKKLNEGYSAEDYLLKGENKTVTLVVWMPENVGNDANYKTGEAVPEINLGINAVATQHTHEKDSFGPDYDENAEYPEVDAANLAATLNELEDNAVITVTGTVVEPLTISKPVTIHNLTSTAPVTIESDGVKLNAANITYKAAKTPAISVKKGCKDIAITNSVIEAGTTNEGTHTAVSIPASGKVVFTGNTVINDYNGIEFDLKGPLGNGSVIANNTFNTGNNAISIYQVEDGATVTIKNNKFNGKNGSYVPVRLSNANNANGTFVFSGNTVGDNTPYCIILLEDYTNKIGTLQDFTKYTLKFESNNYSGDFKQIEVFEDGKGAITTNQPNVVG